MQKILRSTFLWLFLTALAICSTHLQAQVTLGSSPYQQNFDNIGLSLPEGWVVGTGATSTSLGTPVSFVAAATAWNSTSGNFRNVASATGLTSGASSTIQNQSSNRALAVRQTGSFGDNSAAFSFQLANTSGKTNFAISFRLQSLDVSSPRTATWLLQYGIGASPSTFETVATQPVTLRTGNSTFTNEEVTASFGNALNNLSGPVWIRVVTLTNTFTSGNRPTTGIDDVSLSWSGTDVPNILPSETNFSFSPTAISTNSASKSYTLSGTNLVADVQLSVTGPYSISKNGTDFGPSASFTAGEIASNPTVSVRFSPVGVGPASGTITHNSSGAAQRTVTLSGEGFDPAVLSYTFNNCTTGGEPGSGFTAFSVSGVQVWQCTSFGRNNSNGAQINGFTSGAAQLNEDWLISPAINLSGFNIPVLRFYSLSAFSGTALQVLVSSNYSGTGNPNTATWQPLPASLPATASNVWHLSDNIPLLDYKASGIYIAFKYSSSPAAGASRWTIDDIEIRDAVSVLNVTPPSVDFGEVLPGATSSSAPISFRGAGLGAINLTTAAPFELSADNTSFSDQLSISEATLLSGTTIYVRAIPTTKQLTINGNIRVQGTGIDENRVSLKVSSLPKSITFDLVTYNLFFIGNTISADGASDKTLQRQHIKAIINDLKPDLIGVQEVSGEPGMDSLMADLNNEFDYVLSTRWAYSFDGPDSTFPPQKVGFIYKKSTVRLLSTRVMFESMYDSARLGQPTFLASYPTGTPSSFFSSGRLPFMGNFAVTIGGVTKELRAVVIHAKSGGSQLLDWQRRQYDSKVLKDSLDAFYDSDPLLILGDFNDRLVGSINAGQQSPYQNFINDNTRYRGVTLEAEQAGAASFLGSSGSLIDHIAVSNEWFNEYLETSAGPVDVRSFIGNYTSTTSDHLPVIARFELKSGSVLPVRLLSFTGRPQNGAVRLEWLVANEVNVLRYEVERSTDGRSFEKTETVTALGANQTRLYRSLDNQPLKGVRYYRLKMVDRDNSYRYSSVITVVNHNEVPAGFTIVPNPARPGQVNIRLQQPNTKAMVQLLTADGRQFGTAIGDQQSLSLSLSQMSLQLPAGLYQVVVTEGAQRNVTRLLLIR